MDSFRHMCKTQVGGTMRQITAHAHVCGHTSTCSVYSMCMCKFPTEGRSIYSTEMGHYMCHPIIRSLGPWGAHKGPCSNFIMMGLNVWHMHCWHNNWVSLNYLITKHVWWGRDGREQIVKVWASARKIQENNHACVHTQRTLKHHTRSNSEMQNSLSPPYAPPPITLPVSLTKGHVHTPTRQPRGSPVSNNPSEPPLRVMECGEVADTHHHLFSWIISVLMVYLTVQVPLKMPGSPCVWMATPSQKLICVDRTVSSGGVK